MGSQRIELNTCKKGFLSTHREGANPRKPFISSLFGHAAALEGFFYCIKICIYIDMFMQRLIQFNYSRDFLPLAG